MRFRIVPAIAVAAVAVASIFSSSRTESHAEVRLGRGLQDEKGGPHTVVDKSFPPTARNHPRQIFAGAGMDYHTEIIRDLFPGFDGELVALEWPGMPWETKWSEEEKTAIRARNRKLINETATKDDLLMGNILRAEVVLEDCLNSFPGKQLYMNVEPLDFSPGGVPAIKDWEEQPLPGLYDYLPPSDSIFVLGPHEDSKTSTRVSYAQQFVLWDLKDEDKWYQLLEQRPRNTKEHFLIYLASHYIDYREAAAWDIAQIGKSLHTSGHCEGDKFHHLLEDGNKCTKHPEPRPSYVIPSPYLNASHAGHLWAENSVIFAHYRFALVMENTLRDGYITEKIVNAFIGGAIPIWYGTRQISDIFNSKAFVYYDVNNPEPALQLIAYLEANPEAYDAMLSEPILADGDNTIKKYFSLRDGIGGGILKSRILAMMGYGPQRTNATSVVQK